MLALYTALSLDTDFMLSGIPPVRYKNRSTFNKALIVRSVIFHFIFAVLHVLLLTFVSAVRVSLPQDARLVDNARCD
jgi:hypothetical protein